MSIVAPNPRSGPFIAAEWAAANGQKTVELLMRRSRKFPAMEMRREGDRIVVGSGPLGIEFEAGEEGREEAILTHLLRTATVETVREHLRGVDLGPLVAALEGGASVVTGERVTAEEVLAALPDLDDEGALYDEVAQRLGATSPGERAGAAELALEGLYLARKVDKDSDGESVVYG